MTNSLLTIFSLDILAMAFISPDCWFTSYNIIKIYHECEGGIEKSVAGITVCHYKACEKMTNGDRQGHIFLSHLHTNNIFFFFLLTIKYRISIFKTRRPEFTECSEMRHNNMTSI